MKSIAVTVAVCGLVATGCGGSNGGGTEGQISKADFIKKADAICADAARQTETEFAAFSKKNNLGNGKALLNPSQVAELKEILAPALQLQAKQIEKLGLPSSNGRLIEEFLDEVHEAIKTLEREPQAAASPETLLESADKLVTNYGFKVCGQR
jgi:hypothetical protein